MRQHRFRRGHDIDLSVHGLDQFVWIHVLHSDHAHPAGADDDSAGGVGAAIFRHGRRAHVYLHVQ